MSISGDDRPTLGNMPQVMLYTGQTLTFFYFFYKSRSCQQLTSVQGKTENIVCFPGLCTAVMSCSDIDICLCLKLVYNWHGKMTDFLILSMVFKHKHIQNYGVCKIPSINCANSNTFFLS